MAPDVSHAFLYTTMHCVRRIQRLVLLTSHFRQADRAPSSGM
jgi:hypothetical protein